jgi:outer membrane protein TolC
MKTIMYSAFLLMLGLSGTPIVWAQAPEADSAPPLLTLDEAVRIAEGDNRDVQSSELNVTKAQETVAAAKANYLPKLDTYALGGTPLGQIKFTIPAGSLGTYASTGPIPSKDATIKSPMHVSGLIYGSAAQPLTQLYKLKLSVQQDRLQTDVAREQVRGQQQEVRRQVKDGYYQLAQLQPQVESAKATIRYLTELLDLTGRRLNVQTVLGSELLTVKARLKQQQYQLLTLQDSMEIQKQSLNHLLGRDLNIQFSVEDEPIPDDAELSLKSAQKQAAEQRPDLREAHLQTSIARLDVRRERAQYIPDISLQVSYLSFQNVSFLPQNIGTAGLLMQWQPFDWGDKKHRIAGLNANAKQKSILEQDTEQKVLLDVGDKFRRLKEARTLLGARRDARDADQERLREMTNRYTEKTALLSELLQQQSSLSEAEAQYQQALQGFWTARAEFEKAIGA